MGNYRERYGFDEYEPILRRGCDHWARRRKRVASCRESDWVDFQDNQLRLGRPGEWTQLVPDPAASDGMAVRMPGSHLEWAVSRPLSTVFTSPSDCGDVSWWPEPTLPPRPARP